MTSGGRGGEGRWSCAENNRKEKEDNRRSLKWRIKSEKSACVNSAELHLFSLGDAFRSL